MSKSFDEQTPLPKLDQMIHYLHLLGWNESVSKNSKARVFLSPLDLSDEPFMIVLPTTMSLKDSDTAIINAIESLSEIADLEIAEVIKEITSPRTDIFNIRLIPSRDKDRQDFISVEEISIITHELKNALAFSAHSESEPAESRKESIPRINDIGKDFARRCRFAHTFSGSFGLSIETELTVTQPQLPMANLPPPTAPFERRVLERLVKTYQTGLTGSTAPRHAKSPYS